MRLIGQDHVSWGTCVATNCALNAAEVGMPRTRFGCRCVVGHCGVCDPCHCVQGMRVPRIKELPDQGGCKVHAKLECSKSHGGAAVQKSTKEGSDPQGMSLRSRQTPSDNRHFLGQCHRLSLGCHRLSSASAGLKKAQNGTFLPLLKTLFFSLKRLFFWVVLFGFKLEQCNMS